MQELSDKVPSKIAHDPKGLPPQRTPLKRFVSKLLTWPEQLYFYHRFQEDQHREGDESSPSLKKVSHYLAGRWAAKEAVRKACEHLGHSNGFHSIIILPETALPKLSPGASSRPQALVLRDRLPELSQIDLEKTMAGAADFDYTSLDGQLCEVSISHDAKYATAVALVPVVEEWQSQAVTSKV
ncbi:uncharacterized protein N0V89_001039 [Didymosphaeria variabile]|uniref:4'-phosphopantetheinyl transferase domain-containing protein n=1 Tax=Didymosphaeria variabile TaxID=1932322 RepID=A0A9W8XXA5_9PLEO|nr:uncharacterized protein N0V89_001039 [Didymosphaeria variabile]KAJ4360475.1 hypothetical protein N0V89_001039 [Didymosphaeria variabile]